MKEQIEKPLKIYKKNMREGEFFIGGDPLKLFRIRKIEDINKIIDWMQNGIIAITIIMIIFLNMI